MSALYQVHVSGAPKGEVWKASGRWRWARPAGGIETYTPRSILLDVRGHIARLCRVTIGDVRLVKKPWSP